MTRHDSRRFELAIARMMLAFGTRAALTTVLRIEADLAAEHADWYCSLPWWRMWWAMVTER